MVNTMNAKKMGTSSPIAGRKKKTKGNGHATGCQGKVKEKLDSTFEILVAHVKTGVKEFENDCMVAAALEGKKGIEDDCTVGAVLMPDKCVLLGLENSCTVKAVLNPVNEMKLKLGLENVCMVKAALNPVN